MEEPLAARRKLTPLMWGVGGVTASSLGWARYVGDGVAIVAMHTFGASAPLKQLVEKFGFTPNAVTKVVREVVAR